MLQSSVRLHQTEEVKELVQYSRLRGVRLVPELEMSSHSKALLPLAKARGLKFCNLSFPTMLYDDPAGDIDGLSTLLIVFVRTRGH